MQDDSDLRLDGLSSGSEKDPEGSVSAEAAQKHEQQDEPPNGGYGWVCVACVALINAHTWGINSSYGVFLAYYLAHDTYPGATFLDFAFVGGLSIALALAVAPIATNTTRIFGTRATLLVGVVLETLSLISASFAKQIWQLFLSQGICFGIGMGFLFVGSVGITPQWFTTRRSFAQALGAAGSGIGGLVYSLATDAIIQHISLGWAFRILGILAFSVNITCSMLLQDRNKQVGTAQKAYDAELFRRYEFYLLLAWGFFSMLGYIVLVLSLPDYSGSVGLTPQQGAIVGAMFNLGQGLGRPPIGYFSDSFGRINMALTMTFLSGLFSLVVWIFAKSCGVLIFYAIVGGAVAGTFWATIAPVAAEVVGMKLLPTALSITWLAVVLPCTFSEPIALEIDQGSSIHYFGTQLFTGFIYIAAAMCLVVVRIWRIGEVQWEEAESARDVPSDEEGHPTEVFISSPMARMITWKRV